MHDALVSRYGPVLVIFWIGAMKFTAYEANGIQPLVANSPIMGWLYRCSQRARIFRFTRSSGNCHRSDDWAALAIAASVGYRERAGDTDVSNDAELSIFDTRLGAQLGRIPGFSSGSGTVLVKRYRITRRVHLVIGRVAGIHRCEQKLRRERERRRVLHGPSSRAESTIRNALPRNC